MEKQQEPVITHENKLLWVTKDLGTWSCRMLYKRFFQKSGGAVITNYNNALQHVTNGYNRFSKILHVTNGYNKFCKILKAFP